MTWTAPPWVAVIPFVLFAGGAAAEDLLLYNGEPGGLAWHGPTCAQYADNQNAQAAFTGNFGYLGQPTKYHRPNLRVYCNGKGRPNLSVYDGIAFWYRAADPAKIPPNPKFALAAWYGFTVFVPILDYIEGGVIDTTWRRVVIPMNVLTPATPGATDPRVLVDWLYFSVDSTLAEFHVDDVSAVDLIPPKVVSVTPESDRYLRLRIDEHYDRVAARKKSNYAISSTSDPAYASPTAPIDVGLEVRVRGFLLGPKGRGLASAPFIDHDITLRLPKPLLPGVQYTLKVSGVKDTSNNVIVTTSETVAFDPNGDNPNIKVNHVGYVPDASKVGYVGGYVGDMGGGFWAAGDNGTVLRWGPGAGWSAQQVTGTTLRGVEAFQENDVCTVMRYDGDTWQAETVPAAVDFNDVAVTATGALWIVGDGGTILYRPAGGTTWQTIASGVTTDLRGVHAQNQGELGGNGYFAYFVGSGGTLLDWDGTTVRSTPTVTTEDLTGVAGFPGIPGVFGVGDNGTVVRHQYGHWSLQNASTTTDLLAIDMNENERLMIAGASGVLLRRGGFGLTAYPQEPITTTEDLLAVGSLDERRIVAFGSGGTAFSYDYDAKTWKVEPIPVNTPIRAVSRVRPGALPITDTTAKIVDSAGKVALSVPLTLRHARWHLSGEDVYQFDFSSLTTPGTYRVHVAGLGRSTPFAIGAHAYDSAATVVSRSLYHQRCGMAITLHDHQRPACHTADAEYHSSITGSSLYGGEAVGAKKDVTGGWHDAGDYNKYVPTGTTAIFYLLAGYEVTRAVAGGSPTIGTSDEWGIPESGNGIPDAIDEARWELDWLARMQEADGGLPHKVSTLAWFDDMPHISTHTQYIVQKKTSDTALAAAAFAMAARVFEPYDATLAASYLARAKLAWQLLQANPNPTPKFQNPPGMGTGTYPHSTDANRRAWAAAELYRTTGEDQYNTAFLALYDDVKNNWHANGLWHSHIMEAEWAYVRSTWPTADVASQTFARTRLLKRADGYIIQADGTPYHRVRAVRHVGVALVSLLVGVRHIGRREIPVPGPDDGGRQSGDESAWHELRHGRGVPLATTSGAHAIDQRRDHRPLARPAHVRPQRPPGQRVPTPSGRPE